MTAELTWSLSPPETRRPTGSCTVCFAAMCPSGFVRLSGPVETSSPSFHYEGMIDFAICGQCLSTASELVGVGSKRIVTELEQGMDDIKRRTEDLRADIKSREERLESLFST
jgi:hypothetical protein